MKKIIKLSLIASISCLFVSNLTAGTISPVNFTKYPLPKAFTSQSRGGDLPDKVAATDGVGTLLLTSVTTNKKKIDNSAYNKLMYSNIKKLDNNTTLNNLLQSNQIQVSNSDLEKINTVMGNKSFPDGTQCDDGNPNTVNDIYINNVCKGLSINETLPSTSQVTFENKNYVLNNGIINLNIDTRNKSYNLSFNALSSASIDPYKANTIHANDYIKVITNQGIILFSVSNLNNTPKYNVYSNNTPYTATITLINYYTHNIPGQNTSWNYASSFQININNIAADDNNIQIEIHDDEAFSNEAVGYEINSASLTAN